MPKGPTRLPRLTIRRGHATPSWWRPNRKRGPTYAFPAGYEG
jgi:hypothetical protein